jgi:uncharacterized membrane protein (DUF373 family)
MHVSSMSRRIASFYEGFERFVYVILLAMMMSVVAWSTGLFVLRIFHTYAARLSGGGPADPVELRTFLEQFALLHDVFGAFLVILIGIELMKTVVVYLMRNELHVEIVFTVAMIGIARHAIDLDLKTTSPLTLIGMSTMLAALTFGHHFYRKSRGEEHSTENG